MVRRSSGLPYGIGLLGRFFGSAAHAPSNIAGVVILVSTIAFVLALFLPTRVPPDSLVPIVTAALAYLFGRSGAPSTRC